MARSPSPDFQGGDQWRIAPSALRVGETEAANTACLVAALAREHLLQEGHTDNDDVVSLHASDDNLSDAPRDTFTKFKEKFSNKELTGKPLLSSAAECFNLVYQENTSANDHTLTLLKKELRPDNVKLRVKPTNRAIYQLKHGAMGASNELSVSSRKASHCHVRSPTSIWQISLPQTICTATYDMVQIPILVLPTFKKR